VPDAARLTGGPGLLLGFIAPASLPALGTPGVSESTLHDRDKNNVSPRVGIAWDVLGSDRLALRADYGIYYNRFSALTPLQLSQQPPFTIGAQRSGFLGTQILNNPFPTLPQASQLPMLPTPAQLTGYSASGAPVFTAPLLSITAIDLNLRAPYGTSPPSTSSPQTGPWPRDISVHMAFT
jgi:hypothetical protein